MKFKLDENFGTRTQQLFRAAGHGVQTVRDEELQGTSDQHLYEVAVLNNVVWLRWIWTLLIQSASHQIKLVAL